MTTELTSYSLNTTACVSLVGLPEYSSFPPIFWCSQNLYVNQGFCKCNLSRVERGKGGKEVFMTVINLPPRPTSWHWQQFQSNSQSVQNITCSLFATSHTATNVLFGANPMQHITEYHSSYVCHDVGLGGRFMSVINTSSPLFPLSTLLRLNLQNPWLT